ncbi:ATP-binding protein [Anaerosacchariphilus polymeriproducens]|uniref:ATP-binding protein n=1 Tax=Anaerosacchariphilus polymeriproducens TaxID=1812858 RepID=A0A371AVS9_9FIRM|nr:ATP-binding protein [Anaerosacchariphilus polymeriproducens]RDU23639.1 ATP-binding protein [Anaerosacchariphilus polymeriproducens]
MIERKEYFEKLVGYKDKKIIKVVTGIRRCGKSTLLRMFQEYLLDNGVEKIQIVAINFEDYEFEELKDPKELYKYIKSKLLPNRMVYVILDEIQNVKEFQKVVDSLFIKDNIDIYLTGSNAYMLSGELATLLSGRYIKIEMLPLSFAEYVSVRGEGKSMDENYQEYIETSSFPYALYLEKENRQIKEYLSSIYDTVILKDVIGRKKITDIMMLESVIRFLMDNIGNQLSTKKISDTMTSNGRGINVRTVESYLSAFMNSYIVYQAKRFDIKGKQYLKTLEKYYIVDIGLRNALLGNRGQDVGHILENVVYLELIRRGYEVYVGKVEDVEVDFVVKNEQGTKYIQVAASVRDENTLKRELKPLQKIQDHYPKCIMTLDRDPVADYEGIRRFNALDFFMHKIDI